ncbi:HNH endonuclease signature motif containing protein [Brachybacterium horti]
MTATELGRAPLRGTADACSRPDGSASVPARRPAAALPRELRRPVRGRSEVTTENIARRALVAEDSSDALVLRRILERRRTAHAALYVAELRDLAALADPESLGDQDPGPSHETNAIAAGMVLRTRLGRAGLRLRDAGIAIRDLPLCLDRVESGDLPSEWFDQLVRSVRDLLPEQRHQVDEKVSAWQLEALPPERFRTLLRHLVLWCGPEAAAGAPAASRHVSTDLTASADGTACMTVTGPIPEILDLTKRLDRAAHSVQDAQRQALARIAEGGRDQHIPWDLHGEAAATGRPMRLGAIRYVLMTRSEIGTDGVPVPRMPLRMNLVVPVLSLLGLSDAPATLEGVHPVPIAMARDLCADAAVWHRVLTDPVTGEFLPVAAQQYRPTAAMVEHVKLIDPTCALPGCTRRLTDVGEVDHIEEFDHLHPRDGGPTTPANLHGLCREHHRAKTRGDLDPDVTAGGRSTRWSVHGTHWMDVARNRDLVTQTLARDLARAWRLFQERLHEAEVFAQMRSEGVIPVTPADHAAERRRQRWGDHLVAHYTHWEGPPGTDPPPPPPLPEDEPPPF